MQLCMGIRWGVPKVSVYLPDELYREARMRQLPLSSLVQDAVERALRNSDRQEWILRLRSRPRAPSCLGNDRIERFGVIGVV